MLPDLLKRLKLTAWLKYLPLATAVFLLAVLAGALLFLYRYFYQTVAQVKTVAILKGQVSFSQVNLPLYRDVFSAWESKKKFDLQNLEGLRDPFKPIVSVSAEQTESATKQALDEANKPQLK